MKCTYGKWYRFNREKLAKFLWDKNQERLYGKDAITWEKAKELDHGGLETRYYQDLADAIESNIQDIIEVCPADKERK